MKILFTIVVQLLLIDEYFQYKNIHLNCEKTDLNLLNYLIKSQFIQI